MTQEIVDALNMEKDALEWNASRTREDIQKKIDSVNTEREKVQEEIRIKDFNVQLNDRGHNWGQGNRYKDQNGDYAQDQ